MSPQHLERELGCDSCARRAAGGYRCPLPHHWSHSQPIHRPKASPEQAESSPAQVPERGDSCASIFIQNSQETWMKCNYVSSINPD